MADREWMPRIDRQRCNGCGDCVTACPTGAIGWQDGKAALVEPDKCIYCTTCESICPVNAIELPYLIMKQPKANAQGEHHE